MRETDDERPTADGLGGQVRAEAGQASQSTDRSKRDGNFGDGSTGETTGSAINKAEWHVNGPNGTKGEYRHREQSGTQARSTASKQTEAGMD